MEKWKINDCKQIEGQTFLTLDLEKHFISPMAGHRPGRPPPLLPLATSLHLFLFRLHHCSPMRVPGGKIFLPSLSFLGLKRLWEEVHASGGFTPCLIGTDNQPRENSV